MRFKIKYLLLTLAFALVSSLSYSQKTSSSSLLKQAEKEYKSLRYAYAIPLLEEIIKQQNNNQAALELLASSYQKTKNYKLAYTTYSKLVKIEPIKPVSALAYAEVLANLEQYKESEFWYNKYLLLVNSDKRAQAFSGTYPNVNSFMQQKSRWEINFLNINTDLSEYAPMYYKNGLMFVSNRKTDVITKRVFAWDQTPFSDLYQVDALSKIKTLNLDSVLSSAIQSKSNKTVRINNDDTRKTSNDSKTFVDGNSYLTDTLGKALTNLAIVKQFSNKVNSKYHEGPTALLANGAIMFTRNNYFEGKVSKSSDKVIKLKMFESKDENFNTIIPFPYNNNEYSVGHPALNKAGTLLIFVSDMPGGFGGKDLYFSSRADLTSEWTKPINLGATINTEGDEMFPTIYNAKTLFFSSTGHPGLGGLDVFEVALDNGKIAGLPINLGSPINSSLDYFSLIRDVEGNNGFFSSNRRGNDDIYGFKYKPVTALLKGMLADNLTKQPLANTNIELVINGQPTVITTDNKGGFSQPLPTNSNFSLNTLVAKYKAQTHTFNTNNLVNDTTIVKNLNLDLLASSNAPCDSIFEETNQFIIYYGFDKSDLSTESTKVLNSVIKYLGKNKHLQIAASSFTDSRASDEYNLKLSERRSKTVLKYLLANGISADRIKASFYGEAKLVNHCTDGVACTEALQQLNRRTQLTILFEGRNIEELDCETLISIMNK